MTKQLASRITDTSATQVHKVQEKVIASTSPIFNQLPTQQNSGTPHAEKTPPQKQEQISNKDHKSPINEALHPTTSEQEILTENDEGEVFAIESSTTEESDSAEEVQVLKDDESDDEAINSSPSTSLSPTVKEIEQSEDPDDSFYEDIFDETKDLPPFDKGIKGRCIEFASRFVDLGRANDDGDCLYDSIAQILSSRFKKTITIKDVRELIKEYVDALDKIDSEDNWVKSACGSKDEYDKYKKTVGKGMKDLLKEKGAPEDTISTYNKLISEKDSLAQRARALTQEINKLRQDIRAEEEIENSVDKVEELSKKSKEYNKVKKSYDGMSDKLTQIVSEYAPDETPLWGSTGIDCLILHDIFGIDITTHVAHISEIEKAYVESEEAALNLACSMINTSQSESVQYMKLPPISKKYRFVTYFELSAKNDRDQLTASPKLDPTPFLEKRGMKRLDNETFHIALYSNHFVPCTPKKKSEEL